MVALLADGGPAVERNIWKHSCRALAPSSVRKSGCNNFGNNIQDFTVAVVEQMRFDNVRVPLKQM
jgi:hypothetical protein